MNLENYFENAKIKQKEHKKILEKLKNTKNKKIDEITKNTHNEVFKNINCLNCANCCKTTGPLFTKQDIQRIAKFLKIKEADFEKKYLQIDEDNDFVLKKLPCIFLDDKNYCSIYDVRPKACKEFPHTDRKKLHQINYLTIQNALICPAVYEFIENLRIKNKTF